MGKIRAGHEKNVFPLNAPANGLPHFLTGGKALISDHDGHQAEFPEGLLEKRELDFQGMLLGMPLGKEAEDFALRHDFLAELLVHGNGPQGSLEPPPIVNGSPLEIDPVAGGDHYDRFKVPSLDQFKGLSGDLAGIEIPGMGRDEGDNFSRDFLFGRAVQKFPDLPREGWGDPPDKRTRPRQVS